MRDARRGLCAFGVSRFGYAFQTALFRTVRRFLIFPVFMLLPLLGWSQVDGAGVQLGAPLVSPFGGANWGVHAFYEQPLPRSFALRAGVGFNLQTLAPRLSELAIPTWTAQLVPSLFMQVRRYWQAGNGNAENFAGLGVEQRWEQHALELTGDGVSFAPQPETSLSLQIGRSVATPNGDRVQVAVTLHQ